MMRYVEPVPGEMPRKRLIPLGKLRYEFGDNGVGKKDARRWADRERLGKPAGAPIAFQV